MSDQETPQTTENQPSATADTDPAPSGTPEPVLGAGSEHFRRLAEVEKQKREIQEREKSALTKVQQYEELVRLAMDDPERFNAVMGRTKPAQSGKRQEDPAAIALKEVETLKKALEQREAEEARKIQESQLLDAKSKITQYVSTQKEKYPLVVALGFEEAVADMVHQAFLNGQVLSEDQAAGEIEKRLASRKDQLALIFQAAQQQAKQEAASEKSQKVPTLTRSLQSESPTKSDPHKLYGSREDRLEAMVRDLRSKLTT